MKNLHIFKNSLLISFSFLLTMLMFNSCENQKNNGQKIKVGVYDSRQVALVYYRSDIHMKMIQELKKSVDDAREAGDEELAESLEVKGPGYQELAHKQVFSHLPIPNLISLISDSIPSIVQRHGLDMLISKWQIDYLDDTYQLVDVSADLCQLFHPSEETLNTLKQMQEVEPVPLTDVYEDDVANWCPEE